MELSHAAGRSDDWDSHFGKLFTEVGNIHKFYDPVVPLLGIHSTEMCAYVHQKAWTRVFTAALFVIAANTENCPEAHQQ